MSEVNHTSTKKKRKKKYTNETNENSSDKPDGPAVTDVNTNSVELEKSISCEQEKKKRNKMKRKSKGTENNLSAVNGNCVEPGTVEEGVSNKDASLNKGTALNEEITSSQETILGNGEILNKEILLSNSVLSDKNFGKNKSFSPLSDQDYDVEAEEPDFSDVTRTLDFGDAFEEQTVENGDKIISQNSKKKSKKRKSNLTKVKPPPETLESIKTDMQGDAEVDPENKPFAKFVKTPPPAAFFRRRTVQGIQGETNSEPPNKVSSAKVNDASKRFPRRLLKLSMKG